MIKTAIGVAGICITLSLYDHTPYNQFKSITYLSMMICVLFGFLIYLDFVQEQQEGLKNGRKRNKV